MSHDDEDSAAFAPRHVNSALPMPDFRDEGNNYDLDRAPVDAFGTLETPDSCFLIMSREVIIGRDITAFRIYKADRLHREKVQQAIEAGVAPPPEPAVLAKRKLHAAPSSSGGFLPEQDPLAPDEGTQRPTKRRKPPIPDHARGRFFGEEEVESRPQADHTPNSVPVDVGIYRPLQETVARLLIHGQGPNFYETTKGISREHLRIKYNHAKRVWEAHGLGRNGFFCDDVLIKEKQSVVLVSGCSLQIQNIPIIFRLNNVADGKDGSEMAYSENGKSMSFEFTSSHHGQTGDTDDEMDDATNARGGARREEQDECAVDDEEAGEDNSENIRETIEKQEQSPDDADHLAQVPYPQKKRGPGRPPKNGIMSKREEKLLRKQQQEEAKKNLPLNETTEQALKRKAVRPKKSGDELEGGVDKRPYKSRKTKGEDGTEDPEGDKPVKERSQKHKTPPLELRREDFTEEQLQKPTKNYQLLIDEVMATAPEKGYSLKQIYKRIQEKWPHFYFRVDTKGWESSVRHNLLGSECFKKIDGNWHRVAGVPLDAGKKRKPSDSTADSRPIMYNNGYGPSPYQHHQPGQPGPPHGHQPTTHPTGLGQPNLPPRYPPNGQAYQMHQGPHTNSTQPGGPPHPQGPPRPGFPQHQAPPPGIGNSYAPAGAPRPQAPGSQPPAYNANYTRPPPPPNPFLGPAPATGPNFAHRPPMTRPSVGPPPQQSTPAALPNSASTPRSGLPSVPQHLQPSPAPLAPTVDPALRDYIRSFRVDLVNKLKVKLGKKAEAVTMSVISRGLKLTNRSLVPEAKDYEQHILSVFHKHMTLYAKRISQATAASTRLGVSGTTHSSEQSDKGASAKGPGTNSAVQASPSTGPFATAGPASINHIAVSSTSVPGTKPSMPMPATSTSTPSAPAVSATPVRPPSGSVTNQASNVEFAAPESSSTVGEAARSGPSNASGNGSGSAAAGPTPIVSAPDDSQASESVTIGPATESNGSREPSVTAAAQGAPAAPKTAALARSSSTSAGLDTDAAPTDPVGPVSSLSVAPAGNNDTRPASAAPSPGLNMATSQTPPQNTVGSSASTTSSAVVPVKVGATRLSSSTPGPLASASAVSAARSIPSTPGTPTITDDNVQILDPKLIEVIMSFKLSILPTLAKKIDSALSECLVLSAVCRKLEFTDDTFVQSANEQQRKNMAAAENTLMQHLEIRFSQYRTKRGTKG